MFVGMVPTFVGSLWAGGVFNLVPELYYLKKFSPLEVRNLKLYFKNSRFSIFLKSIVPAVFDFFLSIVPAGNWPKFLKMAGC